MHRVVAISLLAACASATDDQFVVTPLFNHANGRVVVELSRELEGDETVFVNVRRGNFGTLDCTDLSSRVAPLEETTGKLFDGPFVDPKLTKQFYGPEWLASQPTDEMLAAAAAGTDSIIDVCVMAGEKVVARVERDLFQAWDGGKAHGFDGKADEILSGEVMINSAQAYGVRCVETLGEIPFFEKQPDGSYSTYSCLEGTPVPMTITHDDGTIDAPQSGSVSQCDNPQYIYSSCEAGPRVQARVNSLGTRWVMLCRKSIGGFSSDKYNDIALIGQNPYTGKTCFFQNALYVKTDGGHVPHPADPVKSQNLWSGVHGGIGSGIECARCHDGDAFIHSPWIDNAKDPQGRPVVPKMGVDNDYPIGANDSPYALVNAAGQNWTMKQQLVSPQANACLRCHRIGGGQWATDWLSRLEGTDTAWKNITTSTFNQAAHKFWMPPGVAFPTDAAWQGSEFQQAVDFIQACGANPSAAGCVWSTIPTTPGNTTGGGNLRNPVSLDDNSLANQATMILGMNRNAPSNECAECHAPTQTTLNQWQAETDTALGSCLSATTGGEQRNDMISNEHVAQGEFKLFGPYDVAAGSKIEVHMTGTGDPDLYVKRGAEASLTAYDCRPYTGSPTEDCTAAQFHASGPAKFWVGIHGFSEATASVTVSYKTPGTTVQPPAAIVDCMRLEPGHADSPFTPSKIGIYAAAAHLGWFQDTFHAAFPDGEDAWAIQYGQFKNRVGMPKGNHPKLTQAEFDIVAEWFDRGLPLLTTYIAQNTGPTSCTTTISPDVAAHATAMSTQGWGAANKAAGLAMYGCGAATDPRNCLTSLADASTKPYGSGWSHTGTLRVLRELSFGTIFWMRSSADGRFVANGATGGSGAAISDLLMDKDIRVQAAYDPGFFPDNSGWMFQGTPIGAGFCTTSLLTADPDNISFGEPQCSSGVGVGLYQHLGAAVGGGDYFAINSQFTSDSPGPGQTHDPYAGFSSGAMMSLIPMVFDGAHFVAKTPASVASPNEGDSVLSPSTKLVVGRFGSDGNQLGFVLHKVIATPNAASYDVSAPEIGRYCVKGGKPAISFDERFMVYHHYVGPADYADLGFASASDPAFQDILTRGSANVMLLDLVTGQEKRVTTMHAGQYALYPHFRSDGWIYFLVRDQAAGHEYIIASDAALGGGGPAGPTTATLDPHDASVSQGGTVTLTVTLDALAQTNTQVALSVSPAGAGTLPATVTVPAGQVSTSFVFTDSAPSGAVTITASFAGHTSIANITVQTGGTHLQINEVDYDMPSTDTAEFVELYNPAAVPVSLAGKQLMLVNGANGAVYATINLTGTIAAHGYAVVAGPNVVVPQTALKIDPGWTTDKIQNGSPDGVALVDSGTHALIDSLSYEGAMTSISLPGFLSPVSLVEGTAATAADTASVGSICRRQNQDTNNANADWTTCVGSPGAGNP